MTITGSMSRPSGLSPDVQSSHRARSRRARLDHLMRKFSGDLVQKADHLHGAKHRPPNTADRLYPPQAERRMPLWGSNSHIGKNLRQVSFGSKPMLTLAAWFAGLSGKRRLVAKEIGRARLFISTEGHDRSPLLLLLLVLPLLR